MITINLTDIYLCLCKLSASICLISGVTFGFITLAGVDIEHDEGIWGRIAGIMADAFVASIAILIILFVTFAIYEIWKL